MSEFGKTRQQSHDWVQLMVQATEASRLRRQALWDDCFPPEEAEAALRGAKVTNTAGGPIQMTDLLALVMNEADRSPRYPKWQFEPAVLRYLPVFQDTLATMDPWSRHSFFLETNELLNMTPLNALRSGMLRQVFAAAVAANEDY